MIWVVRRTGRDGNIATYHNHHAAMWHADCLNRLLNTAQFRAVNEYNGQVPF